MRQMLKTNRLLVALSAAVAAILLSAVFPHAVYAFDGKAPDCHITYDFGNGQTCLIGNDAAMTM